MKIVKLTLFLVMISAIISSCKSMKKAVSPHEDVGAKELVELHTNTEPRFSTLASRVQVNYNDGKTSQSLTVSLRMQKNETIWVSASILGISIARLLITPDKVSYYETIDKTYFDGDFTLLSSWLGVEVDFQMVQNILLGQAVFPINNNRYEASVSGSNYKLTPKIQHQIFKHVFFINPAHNRMASQQIMQPEEQRVLTVDYVSYQNAGLFLFPKEINLNANEHNNQTRISLDFRTIDVNPQLSFPFRIPSGYDLIRLD